MRKISGKRSFVLMLLLIFACSVALAACGFQNKSEQVGGSAVSGAAPTIDATLTQEGTSAVISYKVSNLKIAGDSMGAAPKQGEGHLHIYVDGVQKAMLKTDAPVRLENIPPGKHTIKLSLQQNDHVPLNVEKVFDVTIKK
ncbi:hypothetical protein YDYSY3_58260 [Paenibacillus chitinolyticus]|uniref:DUF6130 family protein n=1 Tax=Paenibacillus chitinolyticus TaxID=79263 RepID=UPI0026E4C45D|nr:DUF6130 family protein [Paenibacillus chitinolyticus]GKS14826.1 hypothetical protein YDYSY3_58260 [Paenibacillus chitinolyticus]